MKSIACRRLLHLLFLNGTLVGTILADPLSPTEHDAAASQPPVSIRVGTNGLESVQFQSAELLVADAPAWRVRGVDFVGVDGERYKANLDNPVVTFGDDPQQVTWTYPWGAASAAFRVTANELECVVTLRNDSTEPIVHASFELGSFAFPGVANAKGGTGLTGRKIEFDNGVALLANWEYFTGLNVELGDTPRGQRGNPLLLNFRPITPQHEIINAKYFAEPHRPVPPGATHTYQVTLTFGRKDTAEAALTARYDAHMRELLPDTVNWPDRRPIGRLFLCNPSTGWKTNPRGWLFGQKDKANVFTEEGLVEFGADLMKYADHCIGILSNRNAQGVIVWDIEGQELPHAITYIGHPQMLPIAAPEMDRFADAFFQKFRDAGLEVGICIRPTEVYETGKNWPRLDHRDVPDPVQLMSDKIAYAQKRWGCRLFYLDSNVFQSKIQQPDRVPWVMPVTMLQELHRRYPDVLIMPEWSRPEFYAFSAPYKTSILSQRATDPVIRRLWPTAFVVMAADTRPLDEHWDDYLHGVRKGDVLYVEGWWNPGSNQRATWIYEEAAWLNAGPPGSTPAAQRYFHALDPAATTGELVTLLDDEEFLVQKQAVRALGQGRDVSDPILVDKLLAIMAGNETLRVDAADTLGRLGEPAVPGLIAAVNDAKHPARGPAITALGQTRTSSADAVTALLPFLADPSRGMRQLAAQALGQLHATPAVEPLLAILAEPYQRDNEELLRAVVVALGKIGDASAIEPIINLYRQVFSTIVTYSIRGVQDNALRNITGQNLAGRDAWERWHTQQKEAPSL